MKLLFILHSTIMRGATISCLKLVHGLIDNNIVPIIVYPNKNIFCSNIFFSLYAN